MQQDLLVALHDRPDPLLCGRHRAGPALSTDPPSHREPPVTPSTALAPKRHPPLAFRHELGAGGSPPCTHLPPGSRGQGRRCGTRCSCPRSLCPARRAGEWVQGRAPGEGVGRAPRCGPHPSAATNLVPLDDVFQLAQQLGLDLLVQEDVGPGQAVVLGKESRAVSRWGTRGVPGGVRGDASYLHQRFLDGHEHLHVAVHPRGILEIETPPYWKKRATLMKATAQVSSSASKAWGGGLGGDTRLNPIRGPR